MLKQSLSRYIDANEVLSKVCWRNQVEMIVLPLKQNYLLNGMFP